MDTAEAAQRWCDTWQGAWERLDPEPIVALYADDALMSTEPFREPYRGRAGVRRYVSGVFAEEQVPRAWFGSPIVAGDRAAVPWWASLRENGTDRTLAGISLLRFDRDGLVTEQWDSWNVVDERRLPPEWSPLA